MNRLKYICIIILILILFDNSYAENNEARRIAEPIMHYTVSGYFTFANCMLLTNINEDMNLPLKYGICTAMGLTPGFIKEYYDSELDNNEWDWNDIYFNSAGVLSGIVLHYFIFDKPALKNKSLSLNMNKNGLVATYAVRF